MFVLNQVCVFVSGAYRHTQHAQTWLFTQKIISEEEIIISTLDKYCFFFFFFTQVQTPVTLCSGELSSILVVRLAHSADLRSRLRHVSCAPSVAYSTGCSRVVTHPGAFIIVNFILYFNKCTNRLHADSLSLNCILVVHEKTNTAYFYPLRKTEVSSPLIMTIAQEKKLID